MSVGPLSRYRNQSLLQVQDPSRGQTLSLPIRRPKLGDAEVTRLHRFSAGDSVDLLARRYLGSEELYWYLLETNGGLLPDEIEPERMLAIPSLALVTRVIRKGP